MDLLNSLDEWNKNKLKSKVIYGMLFNNEVKKEICSLIIQKNSLAFIFLFEDLTNNPDNTILYKLVKNAMINLDDLEYFKFLKQIVLKDVLISYLENTDLFEFENEFSIKYFDNENFKKTMFGSLITKNDSNFNYLDELFQISLENENWKIMLKWFWRLIKDKYEQTYLVNFDNCIDYTLINISSIILNNFVNRYNNFHFCKLSENAYQKISEILISTDYTFDIIDDFNSKFDSLFLTSILLINIVFVPLKNNYTNILNQINLIENQLSNISIDFTMLYETTRINLVNKCKEEIKINSSIITKISDNLKSNHFLNNSLKFSEYITKILIKKIKNEEEICPYLVEILSDITNFNITYNLETKIYDFEWKDLLYLSLNILKNPNLTNNNPHIRFSFIDIILSFGYIKIF